MSHNPAVLRHLIARRVLIEARYALTQIIDMRAPPHKGDYVRDQINRVLAMDTLNGEELYQLAIELHAIEPPG